MVTLVTVDTVFYDINTILCLALFSKLSNVVEF